MTGRNVRCNLRYVPYFGIKNEVGSCTTTHFTLDLIWFSLVWFGYVYSLKIYQLLLGYLMPKFVSKWLIIIIITIFSISNCIFLDALFYLFIIICFLHGNVSSIHIQYELFLNRSI